MSNTVVLKLAGRERTFKANRDDLMRSSKYFEAMFSHDFAEKNLPVKEIELDEEIDDDIFDSVVQFATSRKIEATPETIEHLLLAAEFFQMEELIAELGSIIGRDTEQKIVGPSNVLDLWLLCLIHQPLKLIAGHLEVFIKSNLDAITAESSFLQLDSESLKTIFKLDGWKIPTKIKVSPIVSAMIIWIKHDLENRMQHYEKLLYSMRYDPDIDVSPPPEKLSHNHISLEEERSMQEYYDQVDAEEDNLDEYYDQEKFYREVEEELERSANF